MRKFLRKQKTSFLIMAFIGVTLPIIALFIANNSSDNRGRAAGGPPEGVIGKPAFAHISPMIKIISPQAGETVTLPLTVRVALNASTHPVRVEFINDGEPPFAVVTNPPYTANLFSLSPGKHTVQVQSFDADENGIISEEVVFYVK